MKKLFTLLIILVALSTYSQTNSPTLSTTVVISQVYGGAGCGTAGCSTYQNDFIELYNRSLIPQTLTGYSVQYASSTGTAWQVTALPSVTLAPGQYFLVAESFGANGTSPLPTPDATGTIAMSSTAGKVALVNTTTAISGACPVSSSIIDFVGYGATANCFEGTGTAPAPSTTTSATRNAAGCTETDNNSTDFTAITPNPRNTASPASLCISLPVTLQNFSANKIGNNTDLHWFVNCLSTSVTFELQRSSDAVNFQTFFISSETKARCAAPFKYSDANLISGNNYYRLKIIDIDGRISYSKIVLVVHSKNDKGLLSIRPTLVNAQAEVYYISGYAEKMQWIITDMQSRVAKKITTSVLPGENKIAIPASELLAGQYLLKGFSTAGSTIVVKFVKQ